MTTLTPQQKTPEPVTPQQMTPEQYLWTSVLPVTCLGWRRSELLRLRARDEHKPVTDTYLS